MVPERTSRRTALAFLAAAATAGCLGDAGTTTGETATPNSRVPSDPADTGDWPMLGGGPDHAGVDLGTSGSAPAHATSVDVDGPMTTPTVVGDVAYVTRGVPTDEGPHATVEAYSLDTSERLASVPLTVDGDPVAFRFSAPNSNRRPVYHRGRVYVAVDQRVTALDPAYEEQLWTTDPVEGLSFNEPPTVTDAGVFVGGPFGVAAFDHDGTREWRRPRASETEGPGPGERFGSPRVPAVAEDRVYASLGAELLALDPADGSTIWSHDPDRPSSSTVVHSDGTLVRAGMHGVEAVTTDGSRQWSEEWPGGAVVRPAVGDDAVYVAGLTGHVVVYDRATGDRRWHTEVGPSSFAQGTVATVSESAVHLLRVDAEATTVRVVALDRDDGSTLWERTREGTRARGVVLSDGRYVFAAETTPLEQMQSSTIGEDQDTSATLWTLSVE